MNVLIRTDSSARIGTGHVMRCLTLADELRAQNCNVGFLCRAHPDSLCSLIAQKGYLVHQLPLSSSSDEDESKVFHAAWLGASQEQDARASREFLFPETAWLVVDHYALDYRWEEALRPYVKRIMAIDDLADRRHDCDLLLDQNYYHEFEARYDSLLPQGCKKLLGPAYAMLRPEFAEARKNLHVRDGKVKRILVFFGGTDQGGETIKAIQAIQSLHNPKMTVDVIVGFNNPRREEIEQLCERLPGIVFHYGVANMAELMSNADLAVGVGGAVKWECAALGLPAIAIGVADNQRQIIRDMTRAGMIIGYPDAVALSETELAQAVHFMVGQPGLLNYMSSQLWRMVDGLGAMRVAFAMRSLGTEARLTTMKDVQSMSLWRNDTAECLISVRQEASWRSARMAWMNHSRTDSNKVLLIGENEGRAIGAIWFEIEDGEAAVSLFMAPGLAGKDCETALIWASERWLEKHRPDISAINAVIGSGGAAAMDAFVKAGYSICRATYKKVVK